MNEVGLAQSTAIGVADREDEARTQCGRSDPPLGIHHDHRDLMMLAKVPQRFGSPNDLPSRIEDRSPAAKRLDGEETGGDAGYQFTGTRRGRQADAWFDEEAVSGDRRVTDPPGDLERETAGRTTRGESPVVRTAQDPDGVVAERRRASGWIPGPEQPATAGTTEAGIDRTQSSISGSR